MEVRDLGKAPEMIDENDDRVSEWDFVGKDKKIRTRGSCVQGCVSVCSEVWAHIVHRKSDSKDGGVHL